MIDFAIVFALMVTGNMLLTNGFGALSLQRNKRNLWFVLLNTFCMAIVMIVCSMLYFVIYKFILDPYNLEPLGILIIILLAGLFNFIIMELIKVSNKEMYFYYDTTYSFVINLGTTIGALFCVNFVESFVSVVISMSFLALGYAIITLLFAFCYSRLHNSKLSKNIRPVPITIITMAVLAMIIYAIGISV